LRFTDHQGIDAANDAEEVLDGMAVLSNLEVLLDGSKANLMKVRQEPLEVLRCRCFVLLACSTVEFDPIAGVEQDRFGVREPFFDFRKGSCNLF
jgi:hypothetical protein